MKKNNAETHTITANYTSTNTINITVKNSSDALVRAIKDGNPNAYHDLIVNETDKIIAYAIKHTNCSYEEAEEVAQNTFIYLWEKKETLHCNNINQLYKLIFTAARSFAINGFRSKKIHDKYCDSVIQMSEEYANSPEEIYEIEQSIQIVKDALAQMPKIRAQVFELKNFLGMSDEEIALKLGITQSTVRSHLSNVNLKLRQILHNTSYRI